MAKQEKPLKSTTIGLMVGTALLFDFMQWLMWFVFMDWLVGLFAFMTFWLWFKLHGVSFMSPKRMATVGGAFVIEIMPILSMLPAWTGAVVVLILDHKAKLLLKDATPRFQKGPPLPPKPQRPTREQLRYLNSLRPQLFGDTEPPQEE